MTQPIMIAPFQSGLRRDLEPWLNPPDSFQEAVNVHVHHGFIVKRYGYQIFGKLKTLTLFQTITNLSNTMPITVTVADTTGYIAGDIVFISGVLAPFDILNNLFFTISNVTGTTFDLDGTDGTALGAFVLGGIVQLVSLDTDRVMGIYRYIMADGTQQSLAFNTTRANFLDTASIVSDYKPLDAAPIMNGGVEDFIWAVNWESTNIVNRLYFTNGKAFDGTLNGIRYYDGSGNFTVSFTPNLNPTATRKLYGAKLLFVIKQRLIALNTYEKIDADIKNIPQRARWCQAQGPSNWDDITPGGGGFVDAPTGDQIISARQIQDQLIVFFTDSVWTLRPVPDPALPFRWDKINNFRACNAKMGSVGYDRQVNALGLRGITGTDGMQTQRIDEGIHLFTQKDVTAKNFGKVFCERNYQFKRWWTLYNRSPVEGESNVPSDENNSVLIFDDESKAWTTYNLAMNCLGYQNLSSNYAYQDFTAANELDFTYEDYEEDESDYTSFIFQDSSEIFCGGDIYGVVHVMEVGGTDNVNGEITEIDVFLLTNEWNPFIKDGIQSQLVYVDFYLDTDELTSGLVQFFKDDNDDPYTSQLFDCLPHIGYLGSIQAITQANPAQVTIPDHGLSTGDFLYIYGVEGMTQINALSYTITVVDANNFTLDGIDSTAFTAYSSGGAIYERAFYKTKVWKRIYCGGTGYEHQMSITSVGQNRALRIHAFKPYFAAIGTRTVTT